MMTWMDESLSGYKYKVNGKHNENEKHPAAFASIYRQCVTSMA